MLACIAVLPLIPATSHWWERNSSQLTVALVLAVPTTAWMFWKAGSAPLIDTGIEYFQFICLLFSLYVVSGGIHLAGDIRATPRNNTLFLAIGGVLASFIGTTGAAMLLIRPLLATNRERVNKVHTVLFTIFIVANCGGLLTPLGDPPLFPGFFNGVPPPCTLLLQDTRLEDGTGERTEVNTRVTLEANVFRSDECLDEVGREVLIVNEDAVGAPVGIGTDDLTISGEDL